MAVVQISKIQVRRGQKNSSSGIPQLSSAEFAWAVDSQELYIGNGSVAEGAPYVGNTKILTEHDNILDLAASYQFASNDTSITLSVPRGLQSKLDEYVSVIDFGAVGDGNTDCVAAFEAAFAQLFRNANDTFKKVLMVPNGEYLFESGFAIPSDVILKGETQGGAVLNIGSNNIRFITSAGEEIAYFESGDSSARPQNIQISNLTIKRTTGQVVLSGVSNSVFDNVKFQGEYVLSNTQVADYTVEPAAVYWINDRDGIKVDGIKFKDCLFDSNSISIKCSQTILSNTEVKFEECKFFVNDSGIVILGVTGQGNHWKINDCEFEEIAFYAFNSNYGRGTQIQRTSFINCGNGTSLSSAPKVSTVVFGEKVANTLINCISDRQQAVSDVVTDLTAAVPEVSNGDKVNFIDRNYSPVGPTDNFQTLTVLSAFSNYITLNYFLKLGNRSRYGRLIITVGDDFQEVALTDDFQYSSTHEEFTGGQLMTNFEFKVEIVDNDDTTGDSTRSMDTVILSYKNPLPGASGTISYDVAYGV